MVNYSHKLLVFYAVNKSERNDILKKLSTQFFIGRVGYYNTNNLYENNNTSEFFNEFKKVISDDFHKELYHIDSVKSYYEFSKYYRSKSVIIDDVDFNFFDYSKNEILLMMQNEKLNALVNFSLNSKFKKVIVLTSRISLFKDILNEGSDFCVCEIDSLEQFF